MKIKYLLIQIIHHGFGYLFYRNTTGIYTKPILNLKNCFVHLNTQNPANHIFGNKTTYNNLLVNLHGMALSYDLNKLNFDNRYLFDDNIDINADIYNSYRTYLPFQYNSRDNQGKFSLIPNSFSGNYTEENIKTQFNNYNYFLEAKDWTSQPVNITIDIQDKVFDKSIVINQVDSNSFLSLGRIIKTNAKKLIVTIYAKPINLTPDNEVDNKFVLCGIIRAYDNKNNQILNNTLVPDTMYLSSNLWYCLTFKVDVPISTDHINILANATLRDNNNNPLPCTNSTVKFGGIIVNEIF